MMFLQKQNNISFVARPSLDAQKNDESIVDCLRNISAELLLSAKLKVPAYHLDFGPSYDGVTIQDKHFSTGPLFNKADKVTSNPSKRRQG